MTDFIQYSNYLANYNVLVGSDGTATDLLINGRTDKAPAPKSWRPATATDDNAYNNRGVAPVAKGKGSGF